MALAYLYFLNPLRGLSDIPECDCGHNARTTPYTSWQNTAQGVLYTMWYEIVSEYYRRGNKAADQIGHRNLIKRNYFTESTKIVVTYWQIYIYVFLYSLIIFYLFITFIYILFYRILSYLSYFVLATINVFSSHRFRLSCTVRDQI